MPPAAQAPETKVASTSLSRMAAAGVMVAVGLLAAGCGAGSASLQAQTDPSMVGSVSPQTAASGDVETVSDEATIRNAVTSADVSQISGNEIAWANADTGSKGAISALVESEEQGQLCRKFTTTRESFNGVALYEGKACMAGPGKWQMLAFSAL
ncbi:MAG: RT0821/Lpp0805 family surface protein [Rhizobiaceae bacterium]